MKQRGFTIIEVVVVIAAVVILAGVGFVAYNNFVAPKQTDTAKTESTGHSGDHDMDTMSQVTSTKDLDGAATSLDDASFENDGLSEIDSQASQF